MKTNLTLKLAIVAAAILTAGLAPKTTAATTNLVQNVGFDLVFYEQGPTNVTTNGTTTVVDRLRVTTKDIIAALGSATSNSFSAHAKLVLVTDVASTNGVTAFEVQDGTNPPVDVSSYFTTTTSALAVSGTLFKRDCDWLAASFGNGNKTGKVLGTVTYDILTLHLGGPSLKASLDVNGFDTTTTTITSTNGPGITVNESLAEVSGTGADANGSPALVKGDVSILGHSIVVQ